MTLTDEAKAIRNELRQQRAGRGPYTKEMRCKIVAWYVRAKDSGMPLADMLRLLGVKPQLIDKWYEADLRRAATIVPVPVTPPADMTKQIVPVVVEDSFPFGPGVTFETPSGYRITGLTLGQALDLLRAYA